MSSIIDALKKSDQNRNQENRTDINNIQFSDNPPNKSRKGFWLLVIVLFMVAVGVYAWQQGWHHIVKGYLVADEKTDNNETVVPKLTPKQPPTKVVNNSPKTDKTTAKPVKNQLIPPKQSDIKAKTEQVKSDQMVRKSQQEDIKPLDKASDTDTIQPKAAKEEQQPKPEVALSNPPSESKDLTLRAEKETTNQLIKSEPTKNPLEPALKQEYLLIHQIDYAIRKNIPSIKINIHIYDPEPENRMVLINGERYNMGDSIEEVLTVVDIVKEGIVVSFEGLEFLIPK